MLGRLLLLIALLSLGALPAAAANRLALVIGIDLYEEIPPLRKAVGDAGALGSTLERLGFAVTVVTNANRRELNRKLSDFQASIRPGDIALVHFSGHGVELDGQNFLLPADVPAPRDGNEDFLKDEAVSLVSIVERLRKSGVATSMVIVDACRDNPFAGKGTRSVGGERGLARVEAPAGTLILYSAGYGQSALDRLGETDTETTSVYTRVLIKHLERPGVDITDIAKDVRDEVEELAATVRHVQRPAYYDELRGRLILKPAEPQSTQQTIEPETTTKQAAVEPKQLQEKAELIDKIGDWALQCGRSGPTNATVCGGTQAVQANPHDIAGTLALMKDESDGSMSLRVAVSTGGYFPKGVAITAAGMKVLLPYRYCEGGLCVASEKMPATIIRMLAKARSIEIQVYGGPDVTYSLAVNSNGLAELAAALERLSPEHVRLLMRPERNILVAKSPSRDVELDASWNLVDLRSNATSRHGNWVKQCGGPATAFRKLYPCSVSQEVRRHDRFGATLDFVFPKSGAGLLLRATVPQEVDLQAGLALSIDGTSVGSVLFTNCLTSCFAYMHITGETERLLKEGKQATMLVRLDETRALQFIFSLKGITAGLAALSKN